MILVKYLHYMKKNKKGTNVPFFYWKSLIIMNARYPTYSNKKIIPCHFFNLGLNLEIIKIIKPDPSNTIKSNNA